MRSDDLLWDDSHMIHLPQECRIAVYDARRSDGEIRVVQDGVSFRYVFDRRGHGSMTFHAGVFVDEASVSGRACYRYPRQRRVAMLMETPFKSFYKQSDELRRRYDRVLTHNHDLIVQGEPFRKMYFGTCWVFGVPVPHPDRKTRGVSFIGNVEHGNEAGYRARKDVARYCLSDNRIRCFGKGILPVQCKAEALEEFQFSIAMENVRHSWYFTEKLIDCFMMHTVPVYWGCPPVPGLFDERGIVRFETVEELESLLPSLTPDVYARMLPHVQENRRRVLEHGLESAESLYARLTRSVFSPFGGGRALSPLRSGLAAAGIRFVAERGFHGLRD